MISFYKTKHNKYMGKEFDRMHGLDWYDYVARKYDPVCGRFTSIDPLCEKYPYLSPYAYCGNNPIIRIDPIGEIWDTVWDIANVVYDAGAAVYNHFVGNHEAAKGHWVDAGMDLAAAAVPLVPAGTSKLIKEGTETVAKITKLSRASVAKESIRKGRLGRQARLKELANDSKLGKSDRGWIKQEQNQIKRGKRTSIRNPKGKILAHPRGKEASKGYSYKESKLQLESNHKLQHKYDNNGKKYFVE